MESTMSGNDLQNRCGLNDTQELRSPAEVDCQQPESPQGGPRHLGEACAPRTGTSARGSGHRPAVACATAPRRPASRLRSGFGSRLRAALLSVLALVLGLPFAGPAAAQEVVEVPRAWALKPSGLSSTQNEFRLLFVTSTRVNALSANISDYNAAVQGRASRLGIPSSVLLLEIPGGRQHNTVDARDNTGTTHTSSNRGVPIYWLRGAKVADDYADFYDGSGTTGALRRTSMGMAIHDSCSPNRISSGPVRTVTAPSTPPNSWVVPTRPQQMRHGKEASEAELPLHR